jgi:hypothetical protein
MVLLKRKRILAAKIEATPGTVESLTNAEATANCYNIVIQQNITKNMRDGEGSFGHLPSVTAGHRGTVTFNVDFSWDGTSTEPVWADLFLPACGLVKSTNTYTPRSEVPGSNVKTLTIGVYQDGRLLVLRGCVGTFTLSSTAGDTPVFEFTFTGIWVAPTDASALTPTKTTDPRCRYAAGATTFNSVALQCNNVTLDVGNEVYLREGSAASNVSGYIAGVITNRKPMITANPEAKLIATQDRYGIFLASTEAIFSYVIAGPGTSTVVIAAPKATIETIQEGDRENLVTDEIDFLCCRNGSTADQEFSIVFTP